MKLDELDREQLAELWPVLTPSTLRLARLVQDAAPLGFVYRMRFAVDALKEQP